MVILADFDVVVGPHVEFQTLCGLFAAAIRACGHGTNQVGSE